MCRIKVLLMEEESYFGHLGLLGGGWEEESRGGSVCVCVSGVGPGGRKGGTDRL